VGVDGLAGDAGRGGDLLHAGVGPLAEHRAGRYLLAAAIV
jgi:hypothetical protein